MQYCKMRLKQNEIINFQQNVNANYRSILAKCSYFSFLQLHIEIFSKSYENNQIMVKQSEVNIIYIYIYIVVSHRFVTITTYILVTLNLT